MSFHLFGAAVEPGRVNMKCIGLPLVLRRYWLPVQDYWHKLALFWMSFSVAVEWNQPKKNTKKIKNKKITNPYFYLHQCTKHYFQSSGVRFHWHSPLWPPVPVSAVKKPKQLTLKMISGSLHQHRWDNCIPSSKPPPCCEKTVMNEPDIDVARAKQMTFGCTAITTGFVHSLKFGRKNSIF